MKIAIRYYTKSGNTKKLAEAIAEVAGVQAHSLETPLEEEVDILFLGSSVYAFGVDEKMIAFIQQLDPVKVKNVVNFSTAALVSSTYPQIAKLLASKKIPFDAQEFHCRGKFKFMHKDRPNEEDLQAVKAFAKTLIK